MAPSRCRSRRFRRRLPLYTVPRRAAHVEIRSELPGRRNSAAHWRVLAAERTIWKPKSGRGTIHWARLPSTESLPSLARIPRPPRGTTRCSRTPAAPRLGRRRNAATSGPDPAREAWTTVPVQPVQVTRTKRHLGPRLDRRRLVTRPRRNTVLVRRLAHPRCGADEHVWTSPTGRPKQHARLVFRPTSTPPATRPGKLAAVLAHFPGFGDAAQTDRPTRRPSTTPSSASSPRNTQTYTADIDPWADGTVGIAITQLPKLTTVGTRATRHGSRRPEGHARARGRKDASLRAGMGGTLAGRNRNGRTPPQRSATRRSTRRPARGRLARRFAVPPGNSLRSVDTATVAALVDRHGSNGLSSVPAFVSAAKSSPTRTSPRVPRLRPLHGPGCWRNPGRPQSPAAREHSARRRRGSAAR